MWIDLNPGKRQDIDNENTYNSVFTYKLSADFFGLLVVRNDGKSLQSIRLSINTQTLSVVL